MNSAHLVEIAQRMARESQALTEAVISWQLVTRPYLDGSRGIARWSNLSDKTVREVAGPTGGLSEFKFLWTRTRGHSSATVDEREEMQLRFHSNTRTDYRSTSPKNLQAPGPLGGALALGEGEEKILEGNAVVSARISERGQEALANGLKTLARLDTMKGMGEGARILRALDASLDVWSETQGQDAPDFALGRQGWKLAVLCGLRDVTLSVADIQDLTGLSKRGAQALVARMTKALPGLVQKIRQGRSFVYEIAWAQVFDEALGERYDERVARHDIRNRRAAQDKAVQETSARRGTGPGYIAYLHSTANAKREQYLADRPLPESASEEFKALVAEGNEMALFEYFKAQEVEAGPVPDSPAVLVEEAAVSRPAQEFLGAQRFMALSEQDRQETLAAMRRRMSGVGSA
ncbi:hypothetical protein A4E84_29865 [Streptomyces qaidamensis]|uniref:Uncharacterized protein n=1 Tax=Streptomyces qaidamensis TaxID=1783515 RepID=A0A143C8Q1_9ACTN|nr:hypothetical protein [Streptomyces qaidamensis]AMW13335.1 hypothetical protein A4E84_29865 [Streptomyces qaidamensis]